MEVKVEVHTVHPSPSESPPLGTRQTWVTPTPSKSHDPGNDAESKRVGLFSAVSKCVTEDRKVSAALTELKEFSQDIETDARSLQSEGDDIQVVKDGNIAPSSPKKKRLDGPLKLPLLYHLFTPIDPHGRSYVIWLSLVTLCYIYNAWCVVLRATFPYQTPSNAPYWMTIDYLSDLVYVLDVIAVKPRLMFLREGFWVSSPRETWWNYRQQLRYKFDMLSLLPLDLFYFHFGTQKVILRLPRLLKLQTFWEFHKALDRKLSSPYIVRVGKSLFYIFYMIHLSACAYYGMSAYEGLASNGWTYDNVGNAYIRCFYFATKTATSIGKNPKPENITEYIFMTIAWLMGVFVFALLIGQIRDIIATATKARAEYRKKMDMCSRYMRRLNLPSELQYRVICWFNYTWSQQRAFDEVKITGFLPSNMKRDVALAVHISTLSKVQLFRDCSSSLLRDLVLQLRPVACLPGDAVVRRGEVGHHMYIVKSGELCVMSPDEREVLATLREGAVFGEISLLGIEGLRRRTATVRSRGYSNLFALSRGDLEAALHQHREAAEILRLRADHIIRENAARLVGAQAATDEPSGLRRRRTSNTGVIESNRSEENASSTVSNSTGSGILPANKEETNKMDQDQSISPCTPTLEN